MIARKIDHKGNPIIRANHNPILYSRQYEVEFYYGGVSELTANVISENIYAQCDLEGNQYIMLESLLGFRRSESALSLADKNIVYACGKQSMHKTTKGWKICC